MKSVAYYEYDDVLITQRQYPTALSDHETRTHYKAIAEYADEIYQVMLEALEANQPNMDLYRSQPYITPEIRLKLVDFALKLLVRLKILPFVFCQGIKIFDRYCLTRIVVLAHAQLAVTTCLWIAAKLAGGNNHFANLECTDFDAVGTINDLGHGSGARFLGPTQRFRHPRLNELVKLCGTKCNYDAPMFIQMELHILTALEWDYGSPCIGDYILQSTELRVCFDESEVNDGHLEMYRTKRFISYASCYLFALASYPEHQVAAVIMDLINDTFHLQECDPQYQRLTMSGNFRVVDYTTYYHIRRHLEQSVRNASTFLLQQFSSPGPRSLHSALCTGIRQPGFGSPLSPTNRSTASVSECSEANYTYLSTEGSGEAMQDVVADAYSEAATQKTGFLLNELHNLCEQNLVQTIKSAPVDLPTVPSKKGHYRSNGRDMLQTPEDEYFARLSFQF